MDEQHRPNHDLRAISAAIIVLAGAIASLTSNLQMQDIGMALMGVGCIVWIIQLVRGRR